jgi:uncharacterized protein VirK/YbjX
MASRRLERLLVILRTEPLSALLYNHCRVTLAQVRQPAGVNLAFFWTTTRYLRDYLGYSLTHRQRRDVVVRQAERLRRLERSFFVELERPRTPLWRLSGGQDYAIWLSANRGHLLEGDFELAFRLDDVTIYTLCFSIGPNLADSAAPGAVMLVGRVQGKRGRFDDIRRATKVLHDISPPALLMSAAEGVALALELPQICGVAGSEQLARLEPGPERFDYDAFWESLSGRRLGGWYQFDAPFPHKLPLETAPHHRRRARRKRRFRDVVREAVRDDFAARFVRCDTSRPAPTAVATIGNRHWALPAAGLVTALALAVVYWAWPRDLVPDWTPYGRVDDVAVVVGCAAIAAKCLALLRGRAVSGFGHRATPAE